MKRIDSHFFLRFSRKFRIESLTLTNRNGPRVHRRQHSIISIMIMSRDKRENKNAANLRLKHGEIKVVTRQMFATVKTPTHNNQFIKCGERNIGEGNNWKVNRPAAAFDRRNVVSVTTHKYLIWFTVILVWFHWLRRVFCARLRYPSSLVYSDLFALLTHWILVYWPHAIYAWA